MAKRRFTKSAVKKRYTRAKTRQNLKQYFPDDDYKGKGPMGRTARLDVPRGEGHGRFTHRESKGMANAQYKTAVIAHMKRLKSRAARKRR